MRDSLLGLLAAVTGFLAVVLLVGEAHPLVWVPFVVTAAALAALAVVDARHAPTVLLVAEAEAADAELLETTLAYEGVTVRRCTGPLARRCPVLAGEPCPYGDGLALALVHAGTGGHDDPPCQRGLAAPVLYYELDEVGPVLRETDIHDVSETVGRLAHV
jgi:hypothetical protein